MIVSVCKLTYNKVLGEVIVSVCKLTYTKGLGSDVFAQQKSVIFLFLAVFVANSNCKNLHIGAMFYIFAA